MSAALGTLEAFGVERAFESARAHVEKLIKFWDWDEEVDLIGVAEVVSLFPSPVVIFRSDYQRQQARH